MSFGFDIDGTITAAPEQFGIIMASLRLAGHKVHILTGTMDKEATPQHYDFRRQQLREHGVAGLYDVLHIVTAPHAKRKAEYCRAHDIAMMFEDSQSYADEIKKVTACLMMQTK